MCFTYRWLASLLCHPVYYSIDTLLILYVPHLIVFGLLLSLYLLPYMLSMIHWLSFIHSFRHHIVHTLLLSCVSNPYSIIHYLRIIFNVFPLLTCWLLYHLINTLTYVVYIISSITPYGYFIYHYIIIYSSIYWLLSIVSTYTILLYIYL